VSASREPGMLRIEVSDDGTGFEATQTADVGLGLQIVQSLAATELGGSFEFTEQDYGTTAVVTVPI
jgi:two-component sensor histidine kinase